MRTFVLLMLFFLGTSACQCFASHAMTADANQLFPTQVDAWGGAQEVSGSITLSPEAVAQRFISIYSDSSSSSSEDIVDKANVNTYKIHNLVYYAQGYFLALFNQKLFSQSFEVSAAGLVEKALTRFFERYSQQDAHTVEQPAKKSRHADETEFDRLVEMHLTVIYKMFEHDSGATLASQTAQEEPCQEAQKSGHNEILDENLCKFFRAPQQVARYIDNFLSLYKGKKEYLRILVRIVKRYISYTADKESIDALHKHFLSINTLNPDLIRALQNSLLKADCVTFSRNASSNVCAVLFFPLQLEELFESTTTLLRNEKVLYLLRVAARYGNILALAHLNDVLDTLKPTDDDSSNSVEAFFHLPDKTRREINAWLEQEPSVDSSLWLGLLHLSFGSKEKSERYFQLGSQEDHPLCLYHSLLLNGTFDELQRPNVIPTLRSYHQGLPDYVAAHFALPHEKESYLVRAGSYGLAHAYYKAASACEDVDNNKALFLYIKAGHGGMARGWQQAAMCAKKVNCPDEHVYSFLKEMIACGDPYGHTLLGAELYENGNNEGALEEFDKSVLTSAHLYGKVSQNRPIERIKDEKYKSYLQEAGLEA